MERPEIDIPVHPAAAVFPMLPDDELAELAEDIKANGLHHPLVLDSEGRLVDGRNRSAACRMVGAEPMFISLPADTDILAYILSENVRRRHMSKGQQAIAIALMIETEEGKRTGGRALTLESKVSETHVSQALTIRRYAPDLAALVLAGVEAFDTAYLAARNRKTTLDADEKKRADAERRLAKLRADAPDLADLVGEWRMSLAEAIAALDERKRRELEARRATTGLMVQTLDFLDPRGMTTAELAEAIASRVDGRQWPQAPDLSRDRLERCAETLTLVIGLMAQEDRNGSS